MGLFINESQHPGVFKNRGDLKAINQEEYRSNYLSEFMLQQHATNQSLLDTVTRLNNIQHRFNHEQVAQWSAITERLHDLKELHAKHELVEQQIQHGLEQLEQQNKSMQLSIADEQHGKKRLINHIQQIDEIQSNINRRLEAAEETNEEIVLKLNHLSSANLDVLSSLEKISSFNEEVVVKMEEQQQLHQKVSIQIDGMEDNQKDLLSRVDHQEGLIEKVMRQIDHVRTSLFERTNFLEEKMEKLYEASIASFQKIKNGSN